MWAKPPRADHRTSRLHQIICRKRILKEGKIFKSDCWLFSWKEKTTLIMHTKEDHTISVINMYCKYHYMMIGLWAHGAFESASVISESCVTSFWWILWTLYHEHSDAGCGLFSREQRVIWDEARTAVGWTLCSAAVSWWTQPGVKHHRSSPSCRIHQCLGTPPARHAGNAPLLTALVLGQEEKQGVWHCKGQGNRIWICLRSCYRLTWSPLTNALPYINNTVSH